MIELINSWAQRIIIVVIICTILEMILPEGKNKKYIKTVLGIYIVYTIISPIMSKLGINNQIDLNKYLNLDNDINIQASTSIDTNQYIEEVYTQKIKEDIKTKVKSLNYDIKYIDLKIETDDEKNYGKILQIKLNLARQEEIVENNIYIEEIVIGEEKNESNISNEEQTNIKQYLAEIYSIDEQNIIIY